MSSKSTTTHGDWPQEDRRAHERYPAESHLLAVDAASGRLLGEIQDISLGGLRLKQQCALQRRSTYEMRIDIRMEGQDRSPILVKARNVWMHSVDRENAVYAGFVFVDLSVEARSQIEALFAELGG